MPAPAILRRCVLWGAIAAVAGCSSAPPRLYVLAPLPPSAPSATSGGGNGGAGGAGGGGGGGGGKGSLGNRTVGVQLVTMPEYLDRPEIVSYAGPYQLSTNRDDRWAERLPANITRVMAENLSTLLGMERVGVAPSRLNDRFDYEVAVEFERFERSMSGDSVLDAYWTVQDGASGKVLIRHRTRLATPVPDDGYPSLVAAMNGNLTALSHDIASAIATLPRKGGHRAGSQRPT